MHLLLLAMTASTYQAGLNSCRSPLSFLSSIIHVIPLLHEQGGSESAQHPHACDRTKCQDRLHRRAAQVQTVVRVHVQERADGAWHPA